MDLSIVIYMSLAVYSVRILLFYIGVRKEKHKIVSNQNNCKLPFVSVIVPAKDEEDNIEKCIRSLESSNYPKELFEIIAVDDRSKDSTYSIMTRLSKEFSNVVVKRITHERKHINLKGKAGAIQHAINDAKGEIVLMTDADCTVKPNWIKTMIEPYHDSKVGLVTSITNVKGDRVFDKVQSIEWIYLTTMGAGGVGLNHPLSCFGNNLSVRKSDFLAVGGYEKIKFSVTEDLALLHSIHNNNKEVRFLVHPDSLIDTMPNRTFGEYLKQHHRWVVGALDMGIPAFLFVLTSLAIWAGIIVSIATMNLVGLISILGLRLLGDYFLTYSTLRTLKIKGLAKWVFPSVFFFIIMELAAPMFLLDRNIIWKNQEFKK